jgi:hypothetical protein
MTEQPNIAGDISEALFECAWLERDPVAVSRALAFIPNEGMRDGTNFVFPREWIRTGIRYAQIRASKNFSPLTRRKKFRPDVVRTMGH